MSSKVNRIVLAVLFCAAIITGLLRNNARFVSQIVPAVLGEPWQESIPRPKLIEFEADGYAYQLMPVADYTINALVVSKKDYRVFSINKTDQLFPYDLCLIWGSNVKNRVHQDRSVQFAQDCRWCTVQWRGQVAFDFNGLANTHLLLKEKQPRRLIKSLVVGDQVMLKGKLVNVKARLTGKGGAYDPNEFTWNTSLSRTDQGAGACEVMFVEDVQILRKANVPAGILHLLSFWALVALIGWNVLRIFIA
jgi:hypothetical protein